MLPAIELKTKNKREKVKINFRINVLFERKEMKAFAIEASLSGIVFTQEGIVSA